MSEEKQKPLLNLGQWYFFNSGIEKTNNRAEWAIYDSTENLLVYFVVAERYMELKMEHDDIESVAVITGSDITCEQVIWHLEFYKYQF